MWVKRKGYYSREGPVLTDEEILALPSPVTDEIKKKVQDSIKQTVVEFIGRLALDNNSIAFAKKYGVEVKTKNKKVFRHQILKAIETNEELFNALYAQYIVIKMKPFHYLNLLYGD